MKFTIIGFGPRRAGIDKKGKPKWDVTRINAVYEVDATDMEDAFDEAERIYRNEREHSTPLGVFEYTGYKGNKLAALGQFLSRIETKMPHKRKQYLQDYMSAAGLTINDLKDTVEGLSALI